MGDEIWVLGATGRSGRAIAARVQAAGSPVVLVGRSRERLEAVAAGLGTQPRVVAGSLDEVLAELSRSAAAVVVNTVGPFARTAARVALACPAGTHYLDLANDVPAATAILDLHASAAGTGRTFVTGAGFGVLATESVLMRLCDGEPAPARVRVDAVASVATEAGALGEALASTVVDGLPSGGRRVERGRLVRDRVGGDPLALTTPDGDEVVTASWPSGELLAAWRATGADDVVAASSEIPHGTAVRLAVPALGAVVRVPAVARFAIRRLARVSLKARAMPRAHSWARAWARWPSGTTGEGWLRAGDASDFTASAAAEVAVRLARGEGAPGASTPAALFGPDLAVAAGGTFFVDGHLGAPS